MNDKEPQNEKEGFRDKNAALIFLQKRKSKLLKIFTVYAIIMLAIIAVLVYYIYSDLSK